MTISKFRSLLYRSARFLGDVSAVRNGTILKRIARRGLGKLFTRVIRVIVK